MTNMTRRNFTRAAALSTALSYSRIFGANERVRVGYIGLGNRGDQVHDAFLEHGDSRPWRSATCATTTWTSPSRNRAPIRRSTTTTTSCSKTRTWTRSSIATPDHWHALMFIDACNAGKDVYVEKPLSLTVVEGRKMVEAAQRTRRVSQVGTQRRSTAALKRRPRFVRSGGIGQVTMARSYHIENEWPNGIGNPPDGDPPSAKDWDRGWVRRQRCRTTRTAPITNSAGSTTTPAGQLTNFGVHNIDMIRWCLGVEYPRRVTALGGKYVMKDNREIPDTLEVIWEYDGTLVTFSQYNANAAKTNPPGAEIELRGTKGTMYLTGGRWEIVPEQVTDLDFFARTPLDRVSERAYRTGRKALIEARSAARARRTRCPRPQLPGLREESRQVQRGRADRPHFDRDHAARQHRPQNVELARMG